MHFSCIPVIFSDFWSLFSRIGSNICTEYLFMVCFLVCRGGFFVETACLDLGFYKNGPIMFYVLNLWGYYVALLSLKFAEATDNTEWKAPLVIKYADKFGCFDCWNDSKSVFVSWGVSFSFYGTVECWFSVWCMCCALIGSKVGVTVQCNVLQSSSSFEIPVSWVKISRGAGCYVCQ